MLIDDRLTRAAKCFPDKGAIVFEGTRLTYKDFNETTNRLAHALIEMGVKKDERVAVVCHNSNHYEAPKGGPC